MARLRRHRNLSNAEIAEATGVIPKTVSMWVAGQEPKGPALLALARLFDVTPDYLLTGEEDDLPVKKAGVKQITAKDVAKPTTKRRA